MARPIVLSNGELHVGINKYGLVHDFYYPYVGFENHAAGKSLRHRVGVWIDGVISWLDDESWDISFSYPHKSLIGHTVARNHNHGIILEFDDAVDAEFSAFMRNVHIINTSDKHRDVRLFMHQAFAIGDSRSNTDTVQYIPDVNGVLHYRGRRAFLVSGRKDNDDWFDQYTMGLFDIEGREGTFRDAEDGELTPCNVEHGRVDSTLRFQFDIQPQGSRRAYYWISVGTTNREALYIHKQVTNQSVHERLDATNRWWQEWLRPAIVVADKINPEHREMFLKSVMIIKSQIDKRGAVIASTDTAMLNYSRDAYGYSWPRDGAHVLWPLIRMGYRDEPYRFFEFCRRGLNPSGYLMHKYRADGAYGSSWHPYLHDDGVVSPPIQEDETALVLFVFSQFYHKQADASLLKEFYEPMVVPMANFLSSFIDRRTGLPKPSYDLWEEVFLTTTYTTAVTYGALLAAANLAEVRGDSDNAVKWRSAAEDIREAAHKHLYNEERKGFYKGVYVKKDGTIESNQTFDNSSVYASYMFGLFPIGSREMDSAVDTLHELFNVKDGNFGLPRYEDDYYRRSNPDVTGNFWFIISLWLAQYYLEVNKDDDAMKILDWVRDQAMPTGVMTEQIDPITKEIASVAPLTWTQAEYVSTLLDTITEG